MEFLFAHICGGLTTDISGVKGTNWLGSAVSKGSHGRALAAKKLHSSVKQCTGKPSSWENWILKDFRGNTCSEVRGKGEGKRKDLEVKSQVWAG